MKNTYFQDELQYLREVGPEFAKVNPQIARMLSHRGSDPDVERLLEGVARSCAAEFAKNSMTSFPNSPPI
ncbi:MAG: type VI secretion system baseplate subunit TssF [Planctomycetes bacterium]|nr:type VI secretion system baseplate subunit TssF [Planctomycetota bacterium]